MILSVNMNLSAKVSLKFISVIFLESERFSLFDNFQYFHTSIRVPRRTLSCITGWIEYVSEISINMLDQPLASGAGANFKKNETETGAAVKLGLTSHRGDSARASSRRKPPVHFGFQATPARHYFAAADGVPKTPAVMTFCACHAPLYTHFQRKSRSRARIRDAVWRLMYLSATLGLSRNLSRQQLTNRIL